MKTGGFTDQRDRIRRGLENALQASYFVSSSSEGDGSLLLLKARREDGRRVNVRFRGVRESEASAEAEPGSPLSLGGVRSGNRFSIIGTLFPLLRPPGPAYARVTIRAGAARLEVVCQDVEWWEDARGV